MSGWDLTVEQELEKFCTGAARQGARAVLLFGSRARNQHTEQSDADVCLIADNLAHDLFRRRYPAPSGYRFLSVFGFWPDEFLHLLSRGNLFVLEIMYSGVALHDDGFLKRAEDAYEQAVCRYELYRTEKGWNWKAPKPRECEPGQ